MGGGRAPVHSFNRPSAPAGGMGSTPHFSGAGRPASRPATLPGNVGGGLGGGSRPNVGNLGGGRPTTLPGSSGLPGNVGLPGNLGGANRPNIGDLGGGSRPSTLPGNVGRPNLPGGGLSRPGVGGGVGGGSPPTSGQINDFLGIGNRPTTLPGKLPGAGGGNLPGLGGGPGLGGRPGLGGGATTLPGNLDRPGLGGGIANRPGLERPGGDRPIINRPGGDNNFNWNNRPGWANIDNDRFTQINNNLNLAVGNQNFSNWIGAHPDRLDHWHNWGDHVHDHWHDHWDHRWNDCFHDNWWRNHSCNHSWWHYHSWWNRYPSAYWYTYPTWATCQTWFPTWNWSTPYYYDYGAGGNVVYQGGDVYINGASVGTAADYAASAAQLATVDLPAEAPADAEMEWMALGTFAVSTSESDNSPTRFLQLAVSKEGVVSGTLYNTTTDKVYPVQGRVDKDTQRVAFSVGEQAKFIAETGLYNLTQNEAPLLVHQGADQTETYLLVRMQDQSEGQAAQSPAAQSPAAAQ